MSATEVEAWERNALARQGTSPSIALRSTQGERTGNIGLIIRGVNIGGWAKAWIYGGL